jgi:hypothetical protein
VIAVETAALVGNGAGAKPLSSSRWPVVVVACRGRALLWSWFVVVVVVVVVIVVVVVVVKVVVTMLLSSLSSWSRSRSW